MSRIFTVPFKSDFIESIADYLLSNSHSRDFSDTAIVFPGKRPSIFLLRALNKRMDTPFLPPARYSIDDYMLYLFKMKNPERAEGSDIDLLYLLFRAIKDVVPNHTSGLGRITESFDEFIEWGSRILNAVEEIEVEWAKEPDLSVMAEYDENVIDWVKEFWKNIVLIKDRFYFNLKKYDLTYRGEVYRYVSENIDELAELIPFERTIFAGFYALNRSEDIVINHLVKSGKAEMILQTDDVEKEVGVSSPYYFHQRLKKEWGMEFEPLVECENKKTKIKIFQAFDTHSEVLGIENILRDTNGNGKDIAIVLPEPSPLIPLIHTVVGASDSNFNITLGYPISRTSLSNLINYIFRLQETKRIKRGISHYFAVDYLNLIRHPYIKTMNIGEGGDFRMLIYSIERMLTDKNRDDMEVFFSIDEIENELPPLLKFKTTLDKKRIDVVLEGIRMIHNLFIHQFENIKTPEELAKALVRCLHKVRENTSIEKYPLSNQFLGTLLEKLKEVEYSVFSEAKFKDTIQLLRFIKNYLNLITVPFTGEPLKGKQIMGLLETRNLNFDKVVVMDVNEGIIPGVNKYDPVLPQGFRSAIGLPLYTDRESIFAHNFFRLIQGANEVYIFYKEGKLQDTDENIKSRFVERIIWAREKEGKKIKPTPLTFQIKTTRFERGIDKNDEIMDRLLKISYFPTAIDTYIKCPLRFYFRFILNLEEWEEIEEEIERSSIGQFAHEFLEKWFRPYVNKKLFIDKNEFMDALQKNLSKRFRRGGGSIIMREIITSMMERFIDFEIERTEGNTVILGLEEKVEGYVTIDSRNVNLLGKIDRVEENNGNILIMDYKTGRINMPNKSRGSIRIGDRREIRDSIRSLQLPIYIYLYAQKNNIPMDDIRAFIYNLRKPAESNYLIGENMDLFLEAMRVVLKEILDVDTPFYPDNSDERICGSCPYSNICYPG